MSQRLHHTSSLHSLRADSLQNVAAAAFEDDRPTYDLTQGDIAVPRTASLTALSVNQGHRVSTTTAKTDSPMAATRRPSVVATDNREKFPVSSGAAYSMKYRMLHQEHEARKEAALQDAHSIIQKLARETERRRKETLARKRQLKQQEEWERDNILLLRRQQRAAAAVPWRSGPFLAQRNKPPFDPPKEHYRSSNPGSRLSSAGRERTGNRRLDERHSYYNKDASTATSAVPSRNHTRPSTAATQRTTGTTSNSSRFSRPASGHVARPRSRMTGASENSSRVEHCGQGEEDSLFFEEHPACFSDSKAGYGDGRPSSARNSDAGRSHLSYIRTHNGRTVRIVKGHSVEIRKNKDTWAVEGATASGQRTRMLSPALTRNDSDQVSLLQSYIDQTRSDSHPDEPQLTAQQEPSFPPSSPEPTSDSLVQHIRIMDMSPSIDPSFGEVENPEHIYHGSMKRREHGWMQSNRGGPDQSRMEMKSFVPRESGRSSKRPPFIGKEEVNAVRGKYDTTSREQQKTEITEKGRFAITQSLEEALNKVESDDEEFERIVLPVTGGSNKNRPSSARVRGPATLKVPDPQPLPTPQTVSQPLRPEGASSTSSLSSLRPRSAAQRPSRGRSISFAERPQIMGDGDEKFVDRGHSLAPTAYTSGDEQVVSSSTLTIPYPSTEDEQSGISDSHTLAPHDIAPIPHPHEAIPAEDSDYPSRCSSPNDVQHPPHVHIKQEPVALQITSPPLLDDRLTFGIPPSLPQPSAPTIPRPSHVSPRRPYSAPTTQDASEQLKLPPIHAHPVYGPTAKTSRIPRWNSAPNVRGGRRIPDVAAHRRQNYEDRLPPLPPMRTTKSWTARGKRESLEIIQYAQQLSRRRKTDKTIVTYHLADALDRLRMSRPSDDNNSSHFPPASHSVKAPIEESRSTSSTEPTAAITSPGGRRPRPPPVRNGASLYLSTASSDTPGSQELHLAQSIADIDRALHVKMSKLGLVK
ncbi:hypothetical protein DFS34DRAFT_620627 [Phlyctochytrium arcticum]|nr:hypothetical protein DFS34DRAFT_620627 [Phlyctochytrium arcticum]